MKTISQYIADFLQGYDNIIIDTNHVQAGSDKYGLFKSPGRDFQRNLDGSTTITEYYQFFAFQRSVSEAERQDDDEWLEDFVYWVDDYPLIYEYPAIDGGRKILEIQAGGCPTPYVDSDSGITYQITINITYEREGQDQGQILQD